MELVTGGTTVGATVPATLEHTLCNALVDTGVTRSCLSEEYYQQLLLPGLNLCMNYRLGQPQEVVSVQLEQLRVILNWVNNYFPLNL